MRIAYLFAAASAAATFAVPAAAQVPYPYPPQGSPYGQPVPQPYPGQPGYGYNYGNNGQVPGTGSPIGQIIDQLLGNRYAVSDRTAVTQCASAVMADAGRRYGRHSQYGQQYGQYGQYGQQPYGNPGYGQGYAGYHNAMRVTAITEVKRRNNNSLRVRGLIDSGMMRHGAGYSGYEQPGYGQPGYRQPGYGSANGYAMGDLKFRCTVDSRGGVTDLRVERNTDYRR